jgi:aspartyl-tRNA(Asn)/glutamyl-tRNA(Gln) amidotransferase subunit B
VAVSYEPVIGLEVHAQLLTESKLFCGCSTAFGAPPNTHVCPVCLGLPGALPVPNVRALEMAAAAGLALGCDVQSKSRFARKNYFYPDLAKNYQTSQYDEPLNLRGELSVDLEGGPKVIGITRIHVEEDAAKNMHGVGKGTTTLVDFNRAGTALCEIVSEPDLRSAVEAEAYLKKLREVLMFLGVNDGNLEEGSFRCDANVSIRPVGQEKFGTRVELKNINSFRFVRKAIDHEIMRQEAVLSAGGTIVQETRTWSEGQQKTVSMRGKEEAHDYRYFPCPDLPVIDIPEARVAEIRASLPELPTARRARWQSELALTPYDAQVLTGHPLVARYFDDAVLELGARGRSLAKKLANFLQSEVLRDIATDGLSASFPVPAWALAQITGLVEDGTISGKIAKQVYLAAKESGKAPSDIVQEKGLAQVVDTGAIESEVKKVLDGLGPQVAEYRAGKTSLMGFFVGQVMRATRGKANPQAVNEALSKLLDGG